MLRRAGLISSVTVVRDSNQQPPSEWKGRSFMAAFYFCCSRVSVEQSFYCITWVKMTHVSRNRGERPRSAETFRDRTSSGRHRWEKTQSVNVYRNSCSHLSITVTPTWGQRSAEASSSVWWLTLKPMKEQHENWTKTNTDAKRVDF